MKIEVDAKDMSVRDAFPNATLPEPASLDEICEVESQLQVKFPQSLKDLYLECDGFREPKGNSQNLLSLRKGTSSLFETTRFLWAGEEYWRPTGIDPTEYIFFGSSSASEFWGIRIDPPHDVIGYHHNQEDELDRLGQDVLEVFRNDFEKYED